MKVSMVITTYERDLLLRQSLARLLQLTLPDELIVVDDGGDDETKVVCDGFRAASGIPVTYLYNDNPGHSLCSLARNIGARHAAHEWVITSEPELVFVTDVVRQFKDLSAENPNDVISTGLVFFQPEGLRGHQWNPDDPSYLRWQRADGWVAPHAALWGRNWLYAVGGWDEQFPGSWGWDDTDILTRLRLAGHGQCIGTNVTGVHLFHGLGGDVDGANENYFRAKSFMRDEADLTDLIANRGIEWGALRTTSN